MTHFPPVTRRPVALTHFADPSTIRGAEVIGDTLIVEDTDGGIAFLPAPGSAGELAFALDLVRRSQRVAA